MERASRALESTDYFQAEAWSLRGATAALAKRDYERLARVLLPLQEARRQKRQIAADSGIRTVVWDLEGMPADMAISQPGCVLIQPPLVGADARVIRARAEAARVPVIVICREPMTRDGRWPIVAIGSGLGLGAGGTGGRSPATGPLIVRTKVSAPAGVHRTEKLPTLDTFSPGMPPDLAWFLSAGEALGDAAMAKVNPEDPPAWQVEDLWEALDAHPDHEKLHQRLAEACRAAHVAPEPKIARRRGVVSDPYGF